MQPTAGDEGEFEGEGSAVPLDVRLGPVDPTARWFVVDIDRDGAPDVVVASPAAAGKVALSAAPARNDFHWPEAWGTTATAPSRPSSRSPPARSG